MLKTWEGRTKEIEKAGGSILYVLIRYFLDSIRRVKPSFSVVFAHLRVRKGKNGNNVHVKSVKAIRPHIISSIYP